MTVHNLPYDSLTEYARLYRVQTSGLEIRLIANAGTMLHQLPTGIA